MNEEIGVGGSATTAFSVPGSDSQTPVASSSATSVVRGAIPIEEAAKSSSSVRGSELSTASSEGRKNGMKTPPAQESSFSQRRTPVSGSRTDATNSIISNNSNMSNASNSNVRAGRKLNQSSSRRTTSSRRGNNNANAHPSLVHRFNGMDNLSGLVVDAKGRGEDVSSYHHAAADSGMSMSHVAWLQALSLDLKQHLDKTMADMREQSRRDFERVLIVLQQESAKRTALEQRLHSQLLLQSETMVAMELKLLRLEAKVESRELAFRQQRFTPRALSRTTNEDNTADAPRSNRSTTSEPIGAVISSGASLTSGVTAGSYMGDYKDDDVTIDEDSKSGVGVDQHEHSEDDDVDDDAEDDDNDQDDVHGENESRDPIQGFASQDSTPTQGSRPMVSVGTLESILLNPMIGETSVNGDTIRAIRGDTDGNSSLGTNMTNSTFTSTVITSATRGDINVRRILPEETEEFGEIGTPTSRGRSTIGPTIVEGDIFTSTDTRPPRSRSQSPLTVHSSALASEALSTASTSVGTSIRSSAAVASARSFQRHSRVVAAAAAAGVVSESRPLANRVVSFNTDILNLAHNNQFSEAGDSITMPDELDNLSEVADTFAHSARAWREEYEARLDALQKRWATE